MNIETLREYCLSIPMATEDMPFKDEYLMFRVYGKWFAVIPLNDLELSVSLKCNPEEATALRARYSSVSPAWHFNKKYWNSILINNEKSVLVNAKKAHQMIQFAKTKNLGHQAEEVLFDAFFSAGKDTADTLVLLQLAESIGLDKNDLATVLDSNSYVEEIEQDIREARKMGVTGVPFFRMNQKYSISGAQSPEVFLNTINKAFEAWETENQKKQVIYKANAKYTGIGSKAMIGTDIF